MSRVITAQRVLFARELAKMIAQNRLLVVSQDEEDGEPMVLVAQELRKLGINMRCTHYGMCYYIVFEDINAETEAILAIKSANDNDNHHLHIGENGEHVAHRDDEPED